MKLTVVIPAYNEEDRLAPMLDAYLDYFSQKYGDEVELIVVVNGSTDQTPELAGAYASSHKNVQVLVEPRRVGKGGALLLGFKAAQGDLVGFADADGSTPPEAFDDLVKKIGDAGAIIASRWRKESITSPRQPLDRRISSRIFNFLVRSLFGLRSTDTQCGAKLMRRDALVEVMPEIGITRWAFDVNLLVVLKRAGYEIKEIPTTWHDKKGSKLNVPRASVEMFLALCRLRLLYSPFKWVVTLYNKFLDRFFSRFRRQ